MNTTSYWVQHETGEVIYGGNVDLCDEPVTPLTQVIAEWQEWKFKDDRHARDLYNRDRPTGRSVSG